MNPKDAIKNHPFVYCCRIVEAWECLRLIGWSDRFWRLPSPDVGPWTQKDLETMVDMAGNAYTIYQFVPFFLATISLKGKQY